MKYKHTFCVLFAALLFACGGEEDPTPGPEPQPGESEVTRKLTGTFSDTTSLAVKKAMINRATTTLAEDSCPNSVGEIVVKAVATASEVPNVEDIVDEDGSFALALDLAQTYYIQFFQDDNRCGELIYSSTQSGKGKGVVIGKGQQDIPLGTVTDLGEGKLFAENDVATYCDNDDDGITDSSDNDDNADGETDEDCDFDGILDFADADLSECEEIGDCDVIDAWPTDGDILYIDSSSGVGYMELYLNNEVEAEGINASLITIKDEADEVIIDGFVVEDYQGSTDYLVVAFQEAWDDFGYYTLSIPAGTLTCTDGTENERDIEVEFMSVWDDIFGYEDDDEGVWCDDYCEPREIDGELDSSDPTLFADDTYYETYTVDAVDGQTIELILESWDFDAYLYLFYGDELTGVLITADDDSWGDTDAYLYQEFYGMSGTFTIVVTSYYSGETGSYTLTTLLY